MPAERRILIAGCGAIGSVIGCLLKQAGHDVTLLGRPWHLDAVGRQGLRVDGIWAEHYAADFHLAYDPSMCTGVYDLIIIAVKSYDTESMVRQVAPLLNEDGVALSMQNGLDNIEILARAFGPERSLGASVLVGAKIPKPGTATVTVQAAPIVIGPLELSDCVMMEKIHSWIRHFNLAKIPCEVTTRIVSCLWGKVFYNAPLNALGALLNVPYGTLGDELELRSLMDRIIDEAFRIAEQADVELSWSSAAQYREFFYTHLLPSTYYHQSSMLQDLKRGRRTEIDALNGWIWRSGETLRIPTPYNEIVTRLIWQRERSNARNLGHEPQ
jgi:2-dehydropantoate 2-reductase